MNNPYSSIPYEDRIMVRGRVSPADLHYLRALFPMKSGVTDKTIACLFHKLINELKSTGLDPRNPDHVAWEPNHPTHTRVDTIIDAFCVPVTKPKRQTRKPVL